jgi:hypothetical protein
VERTLAGEDLSNEDRQAHNLSRSWIINELEARFPAAAFAVETAFMSEEMASRRGDEDVPDVDYVAVLLTNIPDA